MVIYPEGVWYAVKTVADVDEIIETHLVQGGRVERLMLMPDQPFPDEADDAADLSQAAASAAS